MILDASAGHTLVEIVVADPTRHDLAERAARQDIVAATHVGAQEGILLSGSPTDGWFLQWVLPAY